MRYFNLKSFQNACAKVEKKSDVKFHQINNTYLLMKM